MQNWRYVSWMLVVLSCTSTLLGQVSTEGSMFGGNSRTTDPDLSGRFFVVFNSAPGPDERLFVESAGAVVLHDYTVIPAFAVHVPNDQIMDVIAADPRVSFVEPDKPAYALGTAEDPECTDPTGDQSAAGDATQDIISGWVGQPDNQRVQFHIQVQDLATVDPSTGDGLPLNGIWKFVYSLHQAGMETADLYFVEMRVPETGVPEFNWGYIDGSVSYTAGPAENGEIIASEDRITITVARNTFVGAPNGNAMPQGGDVFSDPYVITQMLVGTNLTGGALATMDRSPDTGGGRSYTIESTVLPFRPNPSTLDFGSIETGTSATMLVVVTNESSESMTISGVSSTNLSYEVTPSSAQIAPSGQAQFTATFAPSATGPQLGTLLFIHNLQGSPGSVDVRGTAYPASGSEQRPWGVDAVKAPAVWSTTTGGTIKVGVLDSGIDPLHWELDDRYRGGYNFVSDNAEPWDGNSHGTHVSGTITAELNGAGLVGVSHNVELYALKVLSDAGSGSFADVYAAVDWCLANGIDVINMSLGGRVYDPVGELVFQNAYEAGLLSIAAAGNGVEGTGTPHVGYPAAYQYVMAVGAVGENLQRATFSDFGPNIEIVAPGVDIRSTVPRGMGQEGDVGYNDILLVANPLEFAALTGASGVSGNAVDCGRGLTAADFPASLQGHIALIERGDSSFSHKVRFAQDAGAVGVIIYNNAAGNFSGTLGTERDVDRDREWVPAVSLSQGDGQQLVGSGGVAVILRSLLSDFARYQGTSMASPHVAGVAALVKSANPELTNQQLRDILNETATDLGLPLYDAEFGHGLVNAEAAVARALADPSDPQSGTLGSLGESVTWTGTIAVGDQGAEVRDCDFEGPANNCDRFYLTVGDGLSGELEAIQVTVTDFSPHDLDLVVRTMDGQQIAGSGNFPGIDEGTSFPAEPGTYEIVVVGYTAAAASYNGSATVIVGPNGREPEYVSGGIAFSPNVTPQAPELPRGGEPSVRIDRNGNVYAGGIRGLSSGGVDVWRWNVGSDPCLSDPVYLGQPIEIPEVNAGGPGGGDMEIATSQPDDPNATPVVTIASLLLANVPVAISFDLGQTWERHELGEKVITGAAATDRHWLTAYGNSTVYLSGRELGSPTTSDLWVSTSVDHGRTWTPKSYVQIASSTTPGYIDVDRRAVGSAPGAGNLYYSHQNGNAMFVSVAEPSPITGVSPTGGPLSFKTFVVDNSTSHGHLFDVIRVGTDGTVYAVWSNDIDIYLATSTDQARTWSPPVRVNDPTSLDPNGRPIRTNLMPWLVAGDAGRVGVVWFGSNAANNGDNDGDWSVYYSYTANALDESPTFRQVRASDHYIHASNVSESGLGSGEANNRNLLDFFQVDMDPSGAAVIAFADDHNDFQGQTFVTRQIFGPSLLSYTDNIGPVSCDPVPFDQNPDRVSTDPEVLDFAHDVQVLRRTTIEADVPFDITAIDYADGFASGQRHIRVTMSVSDMPDSPPEACHWMAYFTANSRDDLFDRGQSFFVEATTDPQDDASTLFPRYFWGTAARRADGGFEHLRVGGANGGFIDPVADQVTVFLNVGQINSVAEPDVEPGSTLIGLRGLSYIGSFEVTLPVLGPTNGSDVERDFTRGGIAFVVGSQDPRVVIGSDDPALSRSGGWHTVKDERASDGHYLRNVGAKHEEDESDDDEEERKRKAKSRAWLEFLFTGYRVEMDIARGPRGGNAEVFIDGVSRGIVDFYRAPVDEEKPDRSGRKDLTFGEAMTFDVPTGEHVFRLEVLNASDDSQARRDMVYVDGFVVTGEPEGSGDPAETSSETVTSVDPSDIVSQVITAGSSTTLMTAVLDVPEGSDLDLVILDPLGSILGQSASSETPEVVRFIPSMTGGYVIQVVSKSPGIADALLNTVVTNRSTQPQRTPSEAKTGEVPEVFTLMQNYPNPFNPETRIDYGIPEQGYVTLRVYDMLGKVVADLVNTHRPAGYHFASMNARSIASGTYFYRLDYIDPSGIIHSQVRTMVLMK